jgi:hypothetical protein
MQEFALGSYPIKFREHDFSLNNIFPNLRNCNFSPSRNHRKAIHSSLESSCQSGSNGSKITFLESIDKRLTFGKLANLTFYSSILVMRFYHHQNRFDETILTSYKSPFYDF